MPNRRAVTIAMVLLCAASLALSAYGLVQYSGYERGIVEPLKEDLVRRTREAAAGIETSLAPARAAAEAMARQLDSASELREGRLRELLRTTLESDDSFYGGTVAFEPYLFDSRRRLFAPYLAKKNGGLEYMQIEEGYDYTLPEWEWYGRALSEGDRWSEPYFDTSVGDILMTTYSARFFLEGRADGPSGIVTIDIPMDRIREVVRSLDLGGMGYAALVSREGKFLYHPDEEIVLSGQGLLDMAEGAGDAELSALAARILGGESGIIDHTAPLTGLASWFVYEPVSATGWSLIAVYIKDDAPVETGVLRRWLILVGMSALIFLSTAAALGLRVVDGGRGRIWACSILVSLLLVGGIGFTWRVALYFDSDDDVAGWIATDIAGLKSFQKMRSDRSRERLTEPPVFLPTGILVDSLRFEDGVDMQVRGHIWQKYDSELHRGLERGVLFAGVASLDMDEPHVERIGGTEIVRWPFELVQRVHFETSKYPLMRERFALQAMPVQLARNVVLVPDLEAYPILSAAARPGLDEEVYLPGWEVTRSFFELRERPLATDFGLGGSSSQESLPTLYFNIGVRKEFTDSFVSNLVPLIIVGIVIFLVLLIIEREEERILLMRTGTGFNLSICATLLFVVVFAHIGAREKVAAQEIIYLESFYIVTYLAILWVAVDSILFVRWTGSRFIQYEKNLLPQVLFWPITLGTLWLVTLGTFY